MQKKAERAAGACEFELILRARINETQMGLFRLLRAIPETATSFSFLNPVGFLRHVRFLWVVWRKLQIWVNSFRTDNSDLLQTREQVRREQQMLARENERLLRKLDTIERERYIPQSPMSAYSMASSHHSSIVDAPLYNHHHSGFQNYGPAVQHWGKHSPSKSMVTDARL